jgi:hypothetical protein
MVVTLDAKRRLTVQCEIDVHAGRTASARGGAIVESVAAGRTRCRTWRSAVNSVPPGQ